MTASRWLFGVQADVSFPSFVGGTNTISSIATGTVSELERVEFSGHVLGRVGYAPSFAAGHWLFYATGGLAFSYDQFTRTQLAGTPAGGAAVPGTIENVFLALRVGGAVGGGVETALPAHWTAQLQYLFTDYGNTTVAFPAGAQRFTSDLTLHQLTLGLNYRFNNDGSTSTDKDVTPPALQTDNFAVHAQTTFLNTPICPFGHPIRGRTVSFRTRGARPGMPRPFSACGSGTAPSSGSIRKSTRASASAARSALPASRAAKPIRWASWCLTPAFHALSSARPSISAATNRSSTPVPISSAAR